MFDPRNDNLEYQWRRVNKEAFIAKKFGKFPRPQPELHIEDIRDTALKGWLRTHGPQAKEHAEKQAIRETATAISGGGKSSSSAEGKSSSSSRPKSGASSPHNAFSPKQVASPRVQKPNYENQKPSREIYTTRANLKTSQVMDNFELSQMKLKEGRIILNYHR